MSDRAHGAAKVLNDMETMRRDADELTKLSRTWPQTGRAAEALRAMRKDLHAAYSQMMVLVQEIARMDSQCERLHTVGGVHRPEASYEQAKPQAVAPEGIPMAHRRTPISTPLPDPPTAPREPQRPAEPVHFEVPPPPPRPEGARDLSAICTNIPPHIMEELKAKGFA